MSREYVNSIRRGSNDSPLFTSSDFKGDGSLLSSVMSKSKQGMSTAVNDIEKSLKAPTPNRMDVGSRYQREVMGPEPTVVTQPGQVPAAAASTFVPGSASGNRYNTLSDKSKAFYDGFRGHMKTNHNADINIASGGRTQEEQNYIYGQGRTRPGNKVTWTKNSHHIGGNAIDVVGSNWYKDQVANTLIAEQMRAYAQQNPQYGASFLPMVKDPNHVQFVY